MSLTPSTAGAKPKLFLVPPPSLPIPATRGGAVEGLITQLIRENEVQQRLDLVCVSVPHEAAQEQAALYPHTRIYYLPHKDGRGLWGPVCGMMRRLNQPAPLDPWFNRVAKLVKEENPDLVIGEGGNLLELAQISRQVGRDRMLAHLHMQTQCTPQMESVYGGIIAISRYVAEQWKPTRPMAIHLIPNCVDVARFCPGGKPEKAKAQELRTKLGFTKEDFVVLFCGRICPEKGIHRLVEAVRLCQDPAVKLLVIGTPFFDEENDSAFFAQLRQSAADLQAQGRIVFTGFLQNDAIPDYYRAADAACFPALWDEPAGITAIEAMACGCPIIAARSGGMPEYLEGVGALMIDRDEIVYGTLTAPRPETKPMAEAIADAIHYLRIHPRIRARIGKAGVERAQAFSRQAYYEYFCRLAGASAPAAEEDPPAEQPARTEEN